MKIKPCPFCGGMPLEIKTSDAGGELYCVNCAFTWVKPWADWNNRAADRELEMLPGMICSFESDECGAFEFVVYSSKDDLQMARPERIKKRLLAISFADSQACERFFAVNFLCIKQICNQLQNQPTKGH